MLNGSELKILGVLKIYLNKIENWSIIKGSSHCVAVNFTGIETFDTENCKFSFDFKTKSSKNLAGFTFSLLDSERELVKFSDTYQNVPLKDCKLDILN